MAEPTVTPPAPETTPPEPPAEPPPTEPKDQQVPYDRFKEVNDQLRTTKAELDKLTRAQKEREEAELSEVEKATKRADEAEARATAAEGKATTLERTGWVTAAARDAGFTDPGDAAAFLTLAEIEDKPAAKKAVEQLAKDKTHLLKQERPTGFGTVGTPPPVGEVPVGPDGKPDHKRGLGQELANALLGKRA